MSTKEFVALYKQCYSGVKNEMMMRSNAVFLNGRFYKDDQVVDGALHAVAWVLFKREDAVLHFPEPYGREITVTLCDVWNNERQWFNAPGEYPLSLPNCNAGIVLASVACSDASNEQEYQMAFDVMQDLNINDIGLGANDYEDMLTLISTATARKLNTVEPEDVTGKEFFAIANVVWKYNPFPSGNERAGQLFRKTMSMTASQLDEIKRLALRS